MRLGGGGEAAGQGGAAQLCPWSSHNHHLKGEETGHEEKQHLPASACLWFEKVLVLPRF